MWARLTQLAAGIWIMAAPAVLHYAGPLATSDRIVGPLVITSSAVALAEVTRAVRVCLVPLAIWLAIAPFVLGGEGVAMLNAIATAAVIAVLSIPRRAVHNAYGGGWKAVLDPSLLSPHRHRGGTG